MHQVQKGALTLTNATEAGTLYDSDALARLGGMAGAAGVPVHLDGARFANAVAALDASPADLSWRAGVDALSFGGTKNGLLGVEAIVFFDPSKAREVELRRKRGGHLFSKHRYLAAQMQAYLQDGLWLELAARANAAAARLAAGLGRFADIRILHPVEANMVFAALPAARHRAAIAAGASYSRWDFGDEGRNGADGSEVVVRLACNWATGDAEIAALLSALGAV